ncbi:MAG: serine/threonine protein kinase, partial [Proteobacteria bacterium]|nr:serine/threonine protein kinase [Pseudomonadota bacterium]
MSEKIHRNSLKPGHKLHWYRIEDILGQGGFGITYLAYDFNLDRKAAIKEYLPIELAVREGDNSVHPLTDTHGEQFHWGLDRFLSEARTLAKFKHPNIVSVLNVFEDNNTAYMVMSYEEGESLQELLTRRKTLEEEELMKILLPILGGLNEVHKMGFIHRDIKPANIFLRQDNSPVLLDFGSARQALGEQTKTLTSLISPGYAPFEQYYSKSDAQGPWTDIYGLGATLYRAIVGRAPADAVDRSRTILEGGKDSYTRASETGKGRYSDRFLNAVDHALEFKEENRPQSISEWKSEFKNSAAGIAEPRQDERHIATEVAPSRVLEQKIKKQEPVKAEKPPKKSSTSPLLLLLTLVIIAGIVWAYLNYDKLKPVDSLPQQATVAVKEPVAEIKEEINEEINTAQQIEVLLTEAKTHFDALRLTEPEDNNALQSYNRVLELDPENNLAKQGINRITDKLVSLAQQAMAVDNYEKAGNYLGQAKNIIPDAPNIKLAQDELNLKKTALQKKQTESKNLLEEMNKAIEQGDALTVLSNLEKARSLGIEAEDINAVKQRLKEKLGALATA